MWKPICTDINTFMIDTKEEESLFRICLTDLNKIWIQNLDKESLYQTFQECNPVLEVDLAEAVSCVTKLLKEYKDVQYNITLNDKNAMIKVETNSSSLKIKYEFNCILAEENEVATLLTVPLIQTVYYLEKQQEMLVNLLQRKDKELEQYRLEHESISRADLVTEKFDDKLLEHSNDKLVLKTFGTCKDFMGTLARKYGEVKEEMPVVPVEPWNAMKRKRRVYGVKKMKTAK